MRPLRLTMSAFGPFADTIVLDFTALESSQVLICGPTGAGKSTLLDGMCVALYGETSGQERSAKEMRCSSAAPTTPTELVFDFALGDRTFRVRRRPEYERPKQRGAGLTKVQGAASLWERTGVANGDVTSEGELLASGVRDVDTRIEKLMGFSAEQFRQVIVLAQGKFREFLSADAKAKEELLTVLFGTEIYQRMTEALAKRKSELLHERELTEVERESVLRQAGAADAEALGVLAASVAHGLEVIEHGLPEQKRQLDAVRAELDNANRLAAAYAELDAARTESNSLAMTEKVFDEKRAELEKLRCIAPIVELEKMASARTAEVATTMRAVQSERKALVGAEEQVGSTKAALVKEQNNDGARAQAREAVAKLLSLKDTVTRVDAATKDAAQKRASLEKDKNVVPLAEARLNDAEALLRSAKEQTVASREVAATAAEHDLRIKEARSALALLTRADAAKKHAADAKREIARTTAASRAAEKDHADAKKALADLENAWRKGQAEVLARGLAENEACVVCGSRSHPAPARGRHAVPTDEVLEDAREHLATAEGERAAAQETLAGAVAAHDEAEHVASEAQSELAASDLKDASLTALQKILDAEKTALEEARAERARLPELESAERAAIALFERATSDLKKARDFETRAKEDVARADATKAALDREVPADLRTLAALVGKTSIAERASAALDAAIKSAEAAVHAASTAHAEVAARLKGLEQRARDEADAMKNARHAFVAALADAAVSEPEYERHCTATGEISARAKMIEQYDASRAASAARLERAEEKTRDAKPVDAASVKAKVSVTEAELQGALEQRARFGERADALKTLVERHHQLVQALAATEGELSSVARIADLAKGLGGAPVTFARWVLSAFLDDVLAAASERLWLMSKSRYRLERGADALHRGRGGGLDLVVWDGWTGTTRPVSTLSGGEGFLAALALALGLADVVQAHCGGIHLDALFVDEGFGSLDPESLDLALQTLSDITAEGRLLGIISHVPELRERISTRIELKASQDGSRLQVRT